jgi:hypothetical protein
MQRRELIAGFASAPILPVAAHAQESGPMRHIGVLTGPGDGDPVLLPY